MASSRIGSRRADVSEEAAQSKRAGAYMETSSEGFPPSLSRRARKAAESARMASADAPANGGSTRIPQTSSRPSAPDRYAWKQTLGRPDGPSRSNVSGVSGKTSTSGASASSAPSSHSANSSNQPRNVLRRRQPDATQGTAAQQHHFRNISTRSDSSSSVPQSQASLDLSRDGLLDRSYTDSPASIRVAQRIEISSSAQPVTIYPELDRYRDFKPPTTSANHYADLPYPITTDLPPPTPLFSAASSNHSTFSGSPSTRYSESPGPGPYSRDTTPTSMSSVSPGLVAPMRLPASRSKHSSPADIRSPNSRMRAGSASNEDPDTITDRRGLTSVRESSNSSSSTSTVRPLATREAKSQQTTGAALGPSARRSLDKYASSTQTGPTRTPLVRSQAQSNTTTTRSAHKTSDIANTKAAAPSRPSRDGTIDLQSQVGEPLPVVHSNLSSTSLADRRRSGQNPFSRTNTPLQADAQAQSAVSRVGREPTPAPHVAAMAPETQGKQPSRTALRTPSPSVTSSLKTRFQIFGRRNKAAPAEKPDRAPRKGPAAGTGHEGYGRLGQVRRRSGNLTGALRAIPGTMSSQESLASNQPSDPFLAERMSPVVIAGGEIIHNRNISSDFSRTSSNQSMAPPRPSISGSRNNSEASLAQDARTTLWPSALPRGETPRPVLGHRRMPSDSSDSDVLTMKSTLAFRRSIQRLDKANQAHMRLPKPITVRSGVAAPSLNSYDTTILSDDSTFSSRPPVVVNRNESELKAAKKLTKRPKSPRKWNIFGRSDAKATSKRKQEEGAQVSAAVQVVQKPPVPFYAIIDSPQHDEEQFADVEDVLREAKASRPPSPTMPNPSKAAPARSERRPSISRDQSQDSVVKTTLAKPATKAQEPKSMSSIKSSRNLRSSAAVPTRTTTRAPPPRMPSKPPSVRPSRLPQVGRIPKVSTRTEPVDPPLPSPMSFSRPFNRSSSSLQLPSPAIVQEPLAEFVAKGPSPPEPSSPAKEYVQEPCEPEMDENRRPSSSASREVRARETHSQKEFMAFTGRKVSGGTSTTGSSSSTGMNFSEATAVIPDQNAPLAEDEVWDEYNDLLDEDGPRGHPSASSSLGRPFHLEVWGRTLGAHSGQALETPIVPGDMGAHMEAHLDAVESECETEFEVEEQVDVDPAPTTSSVFNSEITAKINEVLEIAGAPHSSHDENGIGCGSSGEVSRTQSRRLSAASSQRARLLRDSQASSSSQGSDDNSAVAQVNLRVGSMSVSKWLTFGHVLFSPVRDELVPVVGSLKRHSILVIDGLGNDDWSFYAAETYPAATFFNLSPRAPLSAEQQSSHSSFPLSPPNHHQIQYKSHASKLPFGAQSFTCVVYRFPTIAPESHYRNIINEARRVLKPGGYIELSILDMDMNNMGNHARRAVRRLKERIHIRAPDISLASSSDLLLRLLGRKGFADIKTCRVGVPLASTIAGSTAGCAAGSESSSSSSRTGTATSSSRSSGVGATRKRSHKRETRSVAEMMSAEGPAADESITKMVAKVGRWWYERCYEGAARDAGGRGMWSDQALLAECEEWRTSLKLMVCHARIPDGRGRLASI